MNLKAILLILFLNINLVFLSRINAQTGIYVPQMSTCDTYVQNFMNTHNIPGLSMALTKDGKLVYHRGFGNVDINNTEDVYPYHLFRIASISKPITAITIMKLYQDGLLSMNDKIFDTGGVLSNHPFLSNAAITDNRIYDITIQQLLEHSAGWDRNTNCFPNPTSPYPWYFSGCDPIVAPLHVAQTNGTSNPVDDEDMIYFLLEKGLDFTPGTGYAYSNIGYLVLGEIIESITGMSYEEYVKTQILEPLGASDMHIGKNLLQDKQEREAEYIGNGYTTYDCYGNGTLVPWEYGGFNLEAMDAHGGWIASSRDLLRLITAVDGFASVPDILNSSTLNIMTTPSSNNQYYAKGWSVNPSNNWWHTGALDGTATFMARTSGGYTWAVFLNKRVIGANASAFWGDLDNLPWNCITATSSYPSHDLFETPNSPSIDLYFTPINTNSAQLNWTKGDGNKRIVVAKADAPVDAFPIDGSSYTANSNIGSGSDLGNGNFVVYDGTSNSLNVSNLNNGTTYYFRIFEYHQNTTTGNNKLYLLPKSESYPYYNGCINMLTIPSVHQYLNKAIISIESNATIDNSNSIFQAGQEIELLPGFNTALGFSFEAKIQTCN